MTLPKKLLEMQVPRLAPSHTTQEADAVTQQGNGTAPASIVDLALCWEPTCLLWFCCIAAQKGVGGKWTYQVTLEVSFFPLQSQHRQTPGSTGTDGHPASCCLKGCLRLDTLAQGTVVPATRQTNKEKREGGGGPVSLCPLSCNSHNEANVESPKRTNTQTLAIL